MSLNSSSNSSLHLPLIFCSRTSVSIFTALLSTYYLLLTLFILVLYVGFQRWRKQRPVVTATMTSHSDIFTFNMVSLELIGVLGSCFYFHGIYTNRPSVKKVGTYMFSIISPGQILFHLLTCVERYLAVVHPITYLGLRQSGGIRIRNVIIVCVWLLCFGWAGLGWAGLGWAGLGGAGLVSFNITSSVLILVFSLVIVSFCSLSVLCVLIRPRPGEVDGNRDRADRSKQTAFHTIMAIMGALLLRFLTTLVSTVIYASSVLSDSGNCLLGSSVPWFNLPSSLVLPLLFLHRAGKLPNCKQNTESV